MYLGRKVVKVNMRTGKPVSGWISDIPEAYVSFGYVTPMSLIGVKLYGASDDPIGEITDVDDDRWYGIIYND